MQRFLKKMAGLYELLGIIFLLMLFLSVLIQIIMRNIFNSGSIQLEELARFSLVSLVFLMIPVLTWRGQHIIVDIVILYLPERLKRWFSAISQLLVMVFGLYVLNAIVTIMEFNWNVRTPALAMPNVVFYIPITLGVLAMCIFSLAGAIITLRGREVVQ
ncbi:MAG: TRAP transporter small permease subunit [Sphaerochaeta sp.]|jgi:TRAP-type C4-dicarboxylate transport system permease small subunit|uniref:TRAP transporter small permease n=1 Tax=Sphaerochaeta sp. S2 TaxID=2798868 RepID=UPI0018E9C864|nr:TRAP transporter small permease subunit [Sphaerochaeta sp. S2]MCK9348081.1 TRAP transporter small permease subunit [Sphaerochaeta sp.]MBJ2355123.1 TRAP transporter small permease subunit [Sphaerochaeta sp. S2]MDD4300933.1 TRAP transporter small permease subunit [Sphaerochaeta sp.]MDD4647747.1 TRAP transporter small permease subunit [Sphaerochaeta sp.]MDY0243264.1 TRAP transporter small permease subunit [Sphaerochaeta sp.]